MKDRKGIALIVVIILIVIASITALALASAITNATLLTATRVGMTKALYAAEAGAYSVALKYSRYQTLGGKLSDRHLTEKPGPGFPDAPDRLDFRYDYPDIVYSVLTDADLLLIDASRPEATISGATYCLRNIRLRNLGSGPVIIDSVVIDWVPSSGGGPVKGVRFLQNYPTYWLVQKDIASTTASPVTISTGCMIGENTGDVEFTIFFGNDIRSSWNTAQVAVTFNFVAGGITWSRRFVILNRGYSGNKEAQITSTGKVLEGGSARYKRTIQATYDTGTGNITSWQEIATHL